MNHESHAEKREEKEHDEAIALAQQQAREAEYLSDTDDDFVDSNEKLEADEEKY